ncbi:hypothetical protein Vretifemale_5670 [Volvox reticuliferus]|uniref:Uncharacterized protein n=1 Tax=Volvox reticuliferus TaxID=1737510 RepID=A0A8J4FLY9_9CHLO|nr:hypothetical protein Vretifemale_5670 [Volvox reticuliferus]
MAVARALGTIRTGDNAPAGPPPPPRSTTPLPPASPPFSAPNPAVETAAALAAVLVAATVVEFPGICGAAAVPTTAPPASPSSLLLPPRTRWSCRRCRHPVTPMVAGPWWLHGGCPGSM